MACTCTHTCRVQKSPCGRESSLSKWLSCCWRAAMGPRPPPPPTATPPARTLCPHSMPPAAQTALTAPPVLGQALGPVPVPVGLRAVRGKKRRRKWVWLDTWPRPNWRKVTVGGRAALTQTLVVTDRQDVLTEFSCTLIIFLNIIATMAHWNL